MGEKRKRLSGVHTRPSTKRQSTTPAPQPTPPTAAEPEIPTSFARDGALPVLPACQPDNLSLKEYKSVAESKVLAESLNRSRREWVDGEIFEKFWTKPLKSRKLDPAILEKNPGRDCMVKLGTATMHITPHKFDIRLYQVLRPVKQAPPPPLPLPSQPTVQPQRPPPDTAVQQAPRPATTPRSAPHVQLNVAPPAPVRNAARAAPATTRAQQPPPPAPAAPAQQPAHVQQRSVPAQQQPAAAPSASAQAPALAGLQPGSAPPQRMPQQAHPPPLVTHGPSAAGPPARPTPQSTQPTIPTTTSQPPAPLVQTRPAGPSSHTPQQHPPPGMQQGPSMQQSQPQAAPRPDPVIQLLAMKAATDVKLKELMRIVASGKASREQLQEFQGYIDMLTAASNNNLQPQPQPQMRPPPPPPPPPPHQMPQQPPRQQAPHPGQPQKPMPIQMHHMQPPQMYQHAPPAPPPRAQQAARQFAPPQQVQQRPTTSKKAFPPAPRQEVCGIVFEFIDSYSQGDRFMFPKFTILEYLGRGTAVKASFIVTKKPAGCDEEYYVPITVSLESPYPRVLEHLKTVVADPDSTRTHMKKIMETTKRASDTFLAYRLRREPGEAVPDRTYIEARTEPPPRTREPRAPREPREPKGTNTPMREPKSGDNATQPRSRPRMKHVKKYTRKSPSIPGINATTTASTPSTATNAPLATSIGSPSAPISTAPISFSASTNSPPSPPPTLPPLPHTLPRPLRPPRSRKGRIADPTKSCHICQTSQTSLWRKADIEGENVTVCNACGIKWKTNAHKQAQIAAAIAQGLPIPLFLADLVAEDAAVDPNGFESMTVQMSSPPPTSQLTVPSAPPMVTGPPPEPIPAHVPIPPAEALAANAAVATSS